VDDDHPTAWVDLDEHIVRVLDAMVGAGVESPLEKLEDLAWQRTFRQDVPEVVQVIARRLLTSQMAVRSYRLLRDELVWKKGTSPFTAGTWTLYELDHGLSEPEQKMKHFQRVLSERGLLRKRPKEQ
jgi:hypothetical protein